MSQYKPYPKYKDSGVEWLGDVPEGWIVTSLKRYCNVTDGSHHSPKVQDIGFPFISVTDVGHNNINFKNCKKILEQDFKRLIKEGCQPNIGDILLTKDGTIGRAVIVKKNYPDFVILSSLGLLSPHKKLLNTYLYYYLLSGINIDQMNSMIHGSALKRMTISKIDNLIISFPSLKEQKEIANYLNQKTQKIDTLIEKQQTLIKLLKEKRQAVISHAVAKGLDDNSNKWQNKKIKFNLTLQNKKVTIKEQQVIALENIESKSGRYIKTNSNYKGEDVAFEKGDILFGKLRPYLAKVFKCKNNGVAFGDLLVFRPKNKIDSTFIFYVMLSDRFISIVDSSTYGTKMPRASVEFINEMTMITPPLKEQKEIANYLDQKTQKIDTLIEKATKAIKLLKERRTALISAVVTGKIDIQN